MIVKAAAQALVGFPTLNATFAGDSLTLHQEVAVCVAVALDEGLVTPVVRHADQKTLREIARETHQLVERARAGKARAEDYAGGTFTVSNLGMFNVDTFVAIINPPQAAILAVGAVQRLPVYVGDDLVPRQLMSMTLSADHRVTDGATAARFLARICDSLQQPILLLE
jgi:pyruvate dehydrogenase E2 component (dihydrolipoamide acetyltransferase)